MLARNPHDPRQRPLEFVSWALCNDGFAAFMEAVTAADVRADDADVVLLSSSFAGCYVGQLLRHLDLPLVGPDGERGSDVGRTRLRGRVHWSATSPPIPTTLPWLYLWAAIGQVRCCAQRLS